MHYLVVGTSTVLQNRYSGPAKFFLQRNVMHNLAVVQHNTRNLNPLLPKASCCGTPVQHFASDAFVVLVAVQLDFYTHSSTLLSRHTAGDVSFTSSVWPSD